MESDAAHARRIAGVPSKEQFCQAREKCMVGDAVGVEVAKVAFDAGDVGDIEAFGR